MLEHEYGCTLWVLRLAQQARDREWQSFARGRGERGKCAKLKFEGRQAGTRAWHANVEVLPLGGRDDDGFLVCRTAQFTNASDVERRDGGLRKRG